MSVLEDVNKQRTELKTDSYSTTISELLAMYKRGDLHINPEYQRLFRWDLERQSEYIESLLLNIPTPPLFFATNPDGRTEVIDGLQRLSTHIKFYSPEIFDENPKVAIAENNESEQNNVRVSTLLLAAPLVESLEGFDFYTLPETLTRTLRYTRIHIIVLEKESSRRARFHVFKRLNRSGSVLSDQEIRNCSARLFGNEFPEALRTLSAIDSVRQALNLSVDHEKRMGVEEALLRLLANSHSPTPLKHSVVEFLDDFMEFASEGKFKVDANIVDRVTRTFNILHSIFPSGQAFKFWRNGTASGAFSPNLYDIVSFGIYKNLDQLEGKQEFIAQRISELMQGNEIRDVTGAGSNTRRKHSARLDLGLSWFKADNPV